MKWRNLRRDAKNKQVHQLVRIIMSKFEILQNTKCEKEVAIAQRYCNEEYGFARKTYDWLWVLFYIPGFFLDAMRIFIIFML